jgi:hypothetical protein
MNSEHDPIERLHAELAYYRQRTHQLEVAVRGALAVLQVADLNPPGAPEPRDAAGDS